MPEIVSPHAFEMGALDEVAKERITAIAPPCEWSTQLRPGILKSATEGSQQRDPVAR
jgi:hypothetical protein